VKLTARVENLSGAPLELDLRQRLWHKSSATAAPVAAATPWWRGSLAAGQVENIELTVTLPALRQPGALMVRVEDPAQALRSTHEIIVLPRDWWKAELAALPGGLAVCDPANQLLPQIADAPIKLIPFTLPEPPPTAALIILVAARDERQMAAAAARAISQPLPVLWVGAPPATPINGLATLALDALRNLETSAPAQYAFVAGAKKALRAKAERPPHP
jgi:hypothetical protein